MLGLILCGGQSQRMGSDKGMLKQEEKNWAQSAVDKMAALNIPVKLSVNEQQFPLYEAMFLKNDLIVDNNSLSLKGPLLGTLSCHLAFPNEDIFILACDMPLMEISIPSSLYKIYQQQNSDAYIFTNDGEAEPLCGIYTAKGLAFILAMLNKGELVKYSMKFMLEHLTVTKIPLREEEKKYFRNINTHSELNGL
jgi:molybdopterin-guanine dinucleotide biosynthesis protein A